MSFPFIFITFLIRKRSFDSRVNNNSLIIGSQRTRMNNFRYVSRLSYPWAQNHKIIITIRVQSFKIVPFIHFRGISTKMFNTVDSNYPTNSIQKEAWLKSISIRECQPAAHIEDSNSSTLLQVSENYSYT